RSRGRCRPVPGRRNDRVSAGRRIAPAARTCPARGPRPRPLRRYQMSIADPESAGAVGAAAGPRPARAAAGEDLDVAMTVNGTPVELRVPARLTLLDALRERLGLTGTHTGCEHGVCGMCTILVDGEAARACLLLACQLDGSEIVTVEGL